MKKKLFLKFFVLAVIGAFVTFTSCKDYDDDISKLEKEIAGLSTTLNDLKTKIEAGAVITKVEPTANGVKVTLSDGKTFDLTNGKDGVNGKDGKDGVNGKDGVDGKPGSVVTVGENGNWFIDGKDTELAAKGPKGDKGDDGIPGADGKPGVDGKDGVYYVPNPDGYWYKHDGETVTKGDLWLLPGVITAVVNEYGDVTFSNVKSGDATFAITFYNNKLLRGLVLIPHYYVNGIEAIGFNSISYNCGNQEEGTLVSPKNVKVQYHVNPSSITVDMIDVDNITFAYQLKENKLRSADINAKAEFVSLNDGILTVLVDLNPNEAEMGDAHWNGIEKMDMLALQVPLSEKAKKGYTNFEAIITSDWARVDVETMWGVEIDRDGYLCSVDGYTYSYNYASVEEAKAEETPYLLELVYDKKYNLLDFLATSVIRGEDCELFDPADYGLVWNFDLLDENDKKIVYKLTSNATDQQEFIKINDAKKGSIEARVYDAVPGAGVTDAIGRTPIVRVQLIDPLTKCVVSEGFVKIKWVKDQPVFEAEYPKQDVDFTCDTQETESGYFTGMGLDIKTKWMNTNVMNAMGTYYTEFIHNYTLDTSGLYGADGKLLTGANAWGTVVSNLDDDSGDDEVTDLFSVYLNNICDLTKNTTFTGYVHYTHNVTGQVAVVIKVTLNVNMPKLTVAGHNNTYWQGGNNSSNVFMVNPVQFKTSAQVNPTANYRTDLLNGFTNGTTYTDDINKIVKSSIAGHEPCNVKFVFDAEKLKSYTYKVEGVDHSVAKGNLRVSTDGKNLEFKNGSTWTIASYIQSINPMPGLTHAGEAIYLNESGQDANASGSSWPHKYAKALVGQRVPVKLAADLCCNVECLSRDIRAFEVYFIPPMHINSTFTESFKDWVVGGDYIKLEKAFTLTDFAGYLVSQTPDKTTGPEKERWQQSLWDYYEINNVVWNTAEAKCNLAVVEGSNPPELDVVPGAKNALPINYIITYEDVAPNLNSLKFQNNSGAPLAKDFELYVPVTVGHKWGTLNATVTIKVLKP